MVTIKTWRLPAWSAVAAVCASLFFPAMLVHQHVRAAGPSGTITWAVPADPNELKAVRLQISLFHTMHPTITVKLIQIPNNLDYDTKVATLIAGGAPPDIYASGDVILPTLFTKGYAKDLTPYITRDHYNTSDFFQEEFRYFKYKGDVYALSDNWDTQVMYYNKDLFRQAHLSFPTANWTWSDFRNAARRLTSGTGTKKVYGAVFQTWFAPLYSLIWSNGGDVFSKDGKSTLLNQPAAVQSIQWVADLINKDKVAPTTSVMGATGPDLLFMSGRVGMLVSAGRWDAAEFVAPGGISKFGWAAAPLPKGTHGRANFFHLAAWIIAGNAKNPDAAWEFLKFIVSPRGIAIAASYEQGIPSRNALAHVKTFLSDPTNEKFDLVQPWITSLPTVRLPTEIVNFKQAQSLIDSALDPVWRGRTTAKAGMDALAPKLNAELKSSQ